MNNILLKRIEELCEDQGLSQRQFEQNAGISAGSVSKWKKGNVPNQKSLQKIADYFNVTVGYLIGESDYKLQTTVADFPELFDLEEWNSVFHPELLADEAKRIEQGCSIPVLGNVAAGVPIAMNQDVIGTEDIPLRLSKSGTFFGLRIQGDSMIPKICDGDTVIIKQQSDVESGDIAVVAVDGEAATCKKIIKHDGGITLVPFNPTYEPKFYTNKEIESIPITIIGKVIELRRRF